jgi:PKD repeat protein
LQPTPVPTKVIPQPVLYPVPQETGETKYSPTGWSDVVYTMPSDPDKDGLYEDLNGDGSVDFRDVVLFFKDMDWISSHEAIQYFDFDGDHNMTFKDVIALFKKVP